MAALMMLNPKARRKVGGKKKKYRRKLTAKQKLYFGPGRRTRKKKAAKQVTLDVNPRGKAVAKRKKHSRRRARRKFTSNPRRRFRRNPRLPGAGLLHNTFVPAAIGAAGAIGVDFIMANFPIPFQFRQGPMLPLTKVGIALLIGAAVGSVSSKEAGEEAAAGGVIVALYGLMRGWMATRMPNMPLGRFVPMRGMGNTPFRRMNMRRFVPMKGMGRTALPPGMMRRPGGQGMAGLGFVNPANVSRGMGRFLATR